jgi:hypothetical protein
MRKTLIIAAALLSAVATPAFAADGTVKVNAKVAPKCLFTTDSATITIPELAGSDGKLDTGSVNEEKATLKGWCNGTAAVMSVVASPLDNMASGGTSFDSRVNYTATAAANSKTASYSTATQTGSGETNVGLFSGDVVVTLSGAETPGGKLLLSGDYTGTVTVTLAPAATPAAPAAPVEGV